VSIAILVPTLGRAEKLVPLAENVAATTPRGKYSLIFVLDHADKASLEAVKSAPCARYVFRDGTYPVKINAGYAACNEDLILPTADDVVFHDGWYETALGEMEPWVQVLGTFDLTPSTEDGSHATMPIIRRSYIEETGAAHMELGTVFHEGYHHNCVETETCQLAMRRGVWKFAKNVVIEHRHHAWGTREADETDRKGNLANWDEDMTYFHRRKAKWERR